KRTFVFAAHMSAFGGKADMTYCGNPLSRSRLIVSEHRLLHCTCPLMTQSGHWPHGQLADNRLREQPPLLVRQVTNKQPNGQEVAMNEKYNLELISRRRAFSFLGLAAALSVAVPATVFIATDAEARVGNPGSAVSVAGANRRDRRQDRRYKKSPTTPTTTGQGEKK